MRKVYQKSASVVMNKAEKSAKVYLYGIIGDYWSDSPLTAKSFVRSLTSLEGQGFERVDVRINSPGGDVWEGLGIINAIKMSKMDIHLYNDGICASMGATIHASGKDGNRHAAKSSVFMIHNASTWTWGNSEQMRETADFLDTHDNVLADVFASATKKTADEIRASYFDFKDHWMSAEEAGAIGLTAVEDYQAEEVPENITNMAMQQVAALFSDKVPTIENQHNMGILTSKFKSLSALAKVAAKDITADQMKAVNEEIEKEGIEGVTAVLDSELQETVEAAGKVEGLEASIAEKDQQIQKLQNEKAELEKKLGNAAVPPTQPKSEGDKTLTTTKVEDSFETSFDREVKAAKGLA